MIILHKNNYRNILSHKSSPCMNHSGYIIFFPVAQHFKYPKCSSERKYFIYLLYMQFILIRIYGTELISSNIFFNIQGHQFGQPVTSSYGTFRSKSVFQNSEPSGCSSHILPFIEFLYLNNILFFGSLKTIYSSLQKFYVKRQKGHTNILASRISYNDITCSKVKKKKREMIL